MGKQRKEHPQDSIFASNPFLDGLFDWMDLPEGQQCIAVRDVLWDLLEDVQLDAKQRTLIWTRRRAARSRAIHSAYPERVPGLSPRRGRGVPARLDRHGLRPGKLLPGATRRARQPHRTVGRRPPSKEKGIKKAEENSSLLRSLQIHFNRGEDQDLGPGRRHDWSPRHGALSPLEHRSAIRGAREPRRDRVRQHKLDWSAGRAKTPPVPRS